MKSEPDCYSIDDLERDARGRWDGVRNYQVRNMMRDHMKKGDRALFYHSSAKEIGVVGEMEIVKEAYPDPTQFDPKADHYDAQSTWENPRWLCVDVQFKKKFPRTVTLAEMRLEPALRGLRILEKGSRLSIVPVSPAHYEKIIALAKSGVMTD